VYYAIEIPHGESLISHFDLNSHTTGLDMFPQNDQPDAAVVHLAFDAMVGCGFFLLLISLLFWFFYYKRKKTVPEIRWLLWGTVIAGPLAFLAVEFGWITTEEGRQPWIIYGILRVKDAVNPAQWINVSFSVFSVIYLLLTTTLIVLLVKLAYRPKPPLTWSGNIEVEQAKPEHKEVTTR
jgi:cytochrome d ubiquinol oxidase subunit I